MCNSNTGYCEIMNKLRVKQMILQGPPGTSKTYEAKRIIAKALGFGEKKDDNDISSFLQKHLIKGDKDGEVLNSDKGGWDMVQFHPSYGYEDFVRGITVQSKEDNVIYKTINKVFGNICELARKDIKNPYFLLIDEINRADVATVFGELIYALEYRNEWVTIPYSLEGEQESLSQIMVPDNLYIIGTMNTADKSVGNIDYAIRRRFLFFDCLPDENVIKNYSQKTNDDTSEQVLSIFNAVNDFITDNINEQYRANDFKIGHTYFLVDDLDMFKYKMKYQVLPILREYYIDGIIKAGNQGSELNNYLTGKVEIDDSVEKSDNESILDAIITELSNKEEEANDN